MEPSSSRVFTVSSFIDIDFNFSFQSVTQCLVLAICTVFLFLRIHFLLKLLLAALIAGVYYYTIFHAVAVIYDVSAWFIEKRNF